MGDYDLTGLSSRSFEKLIQALAVKVLGAGTVVFGDGPDGGREATFEGRMDYPSQTDSWAGYCVVQAKFRQRPEGTGKDGEWALAQLEEELKDFSDRKKGRREPDYYIFATNVVLSSVQDKGAKDRVASLFSRYEKGMPVRGWRVWDFDQICAFLDNAEDIRRAYAAWVTAGDVLATVLDGLEPERSDFHQVMTSFLARDLLRDQYANLEQAGHSAEDKIPLARVFVDLPTTPERAAEPPQEDQELEKAKVAELVNTLVEAAQGVLKDSLQHRFMVNISQSRRPRYNDTHSFDFSPGKHAAASLHSKAKPGRFVLIGGPGQGKTTVGQFVCQLFRAALLQDRPRHLLAAEVNDALADVNEHCRAGGLELPRARRFPVRIVLSDLATALSKESELSLLEYIAALIRKKTSRKVSTDDLRTWLGIYPWLLVLDGLDEVPASTNRDEVLRKVEELWVDAAQCEADLLVLATTRPQGYNDDFSPKRYRHLWLAPLSVERALAYANRLVEVRYAGDKERQKKILGRLKQASTNDATARLMRSPLQVTILATLVDQIGPPPQDRWQLFSDYYEVIYRRERERDIPAAAILRDHRSDIDSIHYQVGLLLQLEAEQAGGTEAILPADRFKGIVAARLKEVGYEGSELDELRGAIVEAAAHRLVFLVGLEADRVGFEIRSLQEFMAAQALMSGKDEDVQKRLRRIAPISSWRNAFLFAAGRYFSKPDKEHFQETIFTLCKFLNDEATGEVAQAVLAGSQLALELLEDGVARRQPKYARLLAECACGLLAQPSNDIHAQLAELAGGATEKVLFEHLEKWLGRDVTASLAAWTTLFPLVGQGLSRACTLADQYWPSKPAKQLEVLKVPTAASAKEWWAKPMEEVSRSNHPRGLGFYLILRPEERSGEASKKSFSWLLSQQHRNPSSLRVPVKDLEIKLGIVSLLDAKNFWEGWSIAGSEPHPGWLSVTEGQRFIMEPSASSLAGVLKKVAAAPSTFPLWTPDSLPWVLRACLRAIESPAEAADLADRVAAGELGDTDIWRAAERRWEKHGASFDDVCYMRDCRWPFDQSIASQGVVIEASDIFIGRKYQSLGGTYTKSIEQLEGVSRLREFFVNFLLFELGHKFFGGPLDWLNPITVLWLFGREGVGISPGLSKKIARWAQHEAAWLDVLDSIGRTKAMYSSFVEEEGVEQLLNLFGNHSCRLGLLPMIVEGVRQNPHPKVLALTPVRFEDFDEPPIRRAALLLELARGGLTTARASELATATLEMVGSEDEVLRAAVQILEGFERFDAASERYLLELRSRLQEKQLDEVRVVLDALENSFRRRVSGIGNREVWRSLALPEGLLATRLS